MEVKVFGAFQRSWCCSKAVKRAIPSRVDPRPGASVGPANRAVPTEAATNEREGYSHIIRDRFICEHI